MLALKKIKNKLTHIEVIFRAWCETNALTSTKEPTPRSIYHGQIGLNLISFKKGIYKKNVLKEKFKAPVRN